MPHFLASSCALVGLEGDRWREVKIHDSSNSQNSKDTTSNYFTSSTVISEHSFSPGIPTTCFEIIKR